MVPEIAHNQQMAVRRGLTELARQFGGDATAFDKTIQIKTSLIEQEGHPDRSRLFAVGDIAQPGGLIFPNPTLQLSAVYIYSSNALLQQLELRASFALPDFFQLSGTTDTLMVRGLWKRNMSVTARIGKLGVISFFGDIKSRRISERMGAAKDVTSCLKIVEEDGERMVQAEVTSDSLKLNHRDTIVLDLPKITEAAEKGLGEDEDEKLVTGAAFLGLETLFGFGIGLKCATEYQALEGIGARQFTTVLWDPQTPKLLLGASLRPLKGPSENNPDVILKTPS
jgi:hypothetical protein